MSVKRRRTVRQHDRDLWPAGSSNTGCDVTEQLLTHDVQASGGVGVFVRKADGAQQSCELGRVVRVVKVDLMITRISERHNTCKLYAPVR